MERADSRLGLEMFWGALLGFSLGQGRVPALVLAAYALSLLFAVFSRRLPVGCVAMFLCVFLAWMLNLFATGRASQLLDVGFYRFDGKGLFSMSLLPLGGAVSLALSDYWRRLAFIKGMAFGLLGALLLGVALYSVVGPNGLYVSHNAYGGAGFSLIMISLCIYAVNNDWPVAKYLILVGFLVVVLSESRAFLMGAVVSIVAGVFVVVNVNLRTKVLYSLACGFSVLVVGVVAGYSRFSYAFTGQDFNVNTRLWLWGVAWDFFRDQMFVGHGIGSFNDCVGYDGSQRWVVFGNGYLYGEGHAHNIVLHLLAEQGAFGLLAHAVFWLGSLLFLWRFRRLFLFFAVWFFGLLLGSQFGLNLFTPSSSAMYYFGIGFFAYLDREENYA